MINDPFPIALMLQDESKLEYIRDGEYRNTEPLSLGGDIRVLVTDAEHLTFLKNFLHENQRSNVRVISIEQLAADDYEPNPIAWNLFQEAEKFISNTVDDIGTSIVSILIL